MALNQRQIDHIKQGQLVVRSLRELVHLCREISNDFKENFDNSQEYSLLTETADIEATYFHTSAQFKTFINQVADSYLDFYDGGATLTDRERGKDARKVG